jgi:threonine dehydratase
VSVVTLEDVRAAGRRIAGHVYHSPCVRSNHLSDLLGCRTYVKLDNLQATGSFKERGACNRLLQLSDSEKHHGVICASAGNHAQAVAYHGRTVGVPVTVVMPKYAPLVKISNTRSYGADVILHGESFDDARRHAMQICEEKNLTYIPGFDHPQIIAGAGTLGLEILQDVPDVEAVFVPVGGGGLAAGVVTAIKPQHPEVDIYALESTYAPTLHASLAAGEVTRIATRPSLADGLAVAEIGRLCFDIVRGKLKQCVLVDEPQIASAILRLLEVEKTLVEGAGNFVGGRAAGERTNRRQDGGARPLRRQHRRHRALPHHRPRPAGRRPAVPDRRPNHRPPRQSRSSAQRDRRRRRQHQRALP